MLPLVLAALVHCESLSDKTLRLALETKVIKLYLPSASDPMSWYLATVASLALVYFVTQPWLGNKVGNAGFDTPFVGIGYSWLVRFQFVLSTDSILEHDYTKYKGRPWKLTGNDVPVLPHGKYTHLEVLKSTLLFVNVLKWKVNPQLAILVPTVRTELDAAFANELPPTINEEEWTRVPAIHTLTVSSGASRRESSAGKIVSWFLPCSWEISWRFWRAKRILLPYIATTNPSSLHFGHGQNSCPGRFIPSNVIRIVLYTLLTEFEFTLEEPGRPKGLNPFEFNFPSHTARLMLRRRRKMGGV
ncbi:hypothetical protein RU639_003857 [Aspergillus parasiticus]